MKAFPTDRLGVIQDTRGISINQAQQDGMDLRDYFAAKAMAHWLSIPLGQDQLAIVAKSAYEVADAMMKARKQ
jgi:hypothetical protein